MATTSLLVPRVCEELRTTLVAARGVEGGWPYHVGKRRRLEPTCWAVLALAHADGLAPDVAVLRSWSRQSDWLIDVPGAPPNHTFNALAALIFLHTPRSEHLAQPIVGRLVAAKGERAPQMEELRQDNSLQAWSWVEGTFSWVEPTAWALLLMKKAARQGITAGVKERIAEAERMLIDRACRGGGWNYGNSNVYGKELSAYVPTTALALLALQDRRDHPVVTKALACIQEDVQAERSAVSLALTLICLQVYGRPAQPLVEDLARLADERRHAFGRDDVLGHAMTLYALASAARLPAAFTLEAAV